jgi:hypothetical protein
MGTSTAYGGPDGGTPLVPSWLGGADGGESPTPATPNLNGPPDGQPESPRQPRANPQPIPPNADPQRFTGARTNFSKFARSGGSDRASLGRAISKYVSTAAGGSRVAAQRMGASRGSGARLLGFLADAQSRGINQALAALNLNGLAGLPIADIFLGLADYVCPGGSSVDEGIAREAFVETIIELTENGLNDLTTFTPEQMQLIFETYATHAIEARIYNDIGTKAVMMPENALTAQHVEHQLLDFIRGGVSDAFVQTQAQTGGLNHTNIQSFVDSVYESAFSFLHALAQAETDK